MPITVKAKPPVTQSVLEAAESRLGLRIPAGYHDFLQVMNGGRPLEDAFPPDPDAGVDWFMGVDQILDDTRLLENRLPAGMIPIAVAPGGNLICIAGTGPRPGSIYFWDHEREHLGDGALRLLASSFDDFVSRLEESPPLPDFKVISVEIDPDFHRWAQEQEALEDRRPKLRWPPNVRPGL